MSSGGRSAETHDAGSRRHRGCLFGPRIRLESVAVVVKCISAYRAQTRDAADDYTPTGIGRDGTGRMGRHCRTIQPAASVHSGARSGLTRRGRHWSRSLRRRVVIACVGATCASWGAGPAIATTRSTNEAPRSRRRVASTAGSPGRRRLSRPGKAQRRAHPLRRGPFVARQARRMIIADEVAPSRRLWRQCHSLTGIATGKSAPPSVREERWRRACQRSVDGVVAL